MMTTDNPAIGFLENRIREKGMHIHLTGNEFKLLSKLFQNMGKACSRVFLLRALNEHSYYEASCVDRTIEQLRMKLEDNPREPMFIKDAGDQGYILLGTGN